MPSIRREVTTTRTTGGATVGEPEKEWFPMVASSCVSDKDDDGDSKNERPNSPVTAGGSDADVFVARRTCHADTMTATAFVDVARRPVLPSASAVPAKKKDKVGGDGAGRRHETPLFFEPAPRRRWGGRDEEPAPTAPVNMLRVASSLMLEQHQRRRQWRSLLSSTSTMTTSITAVYSTAPSSASSITPEEGDDNDDNDGNNPLIVISSITPPPRPPIEVDIPILYEDDNLLVINKPYGVPHHDDRPSSSSSSSSDDDGTDADAGTKNYCWGILSHLRYMQATEQLAYRGRLYGVHRLDKVTSGILVLAKSPHVAGLLSRAFRGNKEKHRNDDGGADGNVTKYYVGISGKKPTKKKQGWVRGTMIRGRRKTWQLTRGAGDRGNDKTTKKKNSGVVLGTDETEDGRGAGYGRDRAAAASTTSKAETRFFTCGLGRINESVAVAVAATAGGEAPPTRGRRKRMMVDDASLDGSTMTEGSSTKSMTIIPRTFLLFKPITGKTHQIRVASKSVGMPLLGDKIYGGGDPNGIRTNDVDGASGVNGQGGLGRTYLHAGALHLDLRAAGIVVPSLSKTAAVTPMGDTENGIDGEHHLTVICPPPFAVDGYYGQQEEGTQQGDHGVDYQQRYPRAGSLLWGESPQLGQELLDRTFYTMMEKQCDCIPLRERVEEYTSLLSSLEETPSPSAPP